MSPKPAVKTVVLDDEPARALLRKQHAKHADVVDFIEALGPDRDLEVIVPIVVRVESGWDRAAPGAAFANKTATDHPLPKERADVAVRLRIQANVSVVDACVGEAADGAVKPVLILTSDVGDMKRLAGLIAGDVRVERVCAPRAS